MCGISRDSKFKAGRLITVMEANVRQKKLEQMLILRGKITIEYDREKAETEEMKGAEARELYHDK